LLEKILRHDTDFENFEIEHEFPEVGPKVMSLNARRIYDRERTSVRLILLAIRDLPESERAAEEQKGLEEQLRQAQKMESMGTLAAGLAHDFNNILNIIQGYAFVLRGHAAKNDGIADSLNVINDTTKRGAALVRQLLTLARKTGPKLELTNINTVIEELTKLIRETFPKTIQVTLELNRELPPVMADPNEISQALLNLCVNSRDAMPKGASFCLGPRPSTKRACENTAKQKRSGTSVSRSVTPALEWTKAFKPGSLSLSSLPKSLGEPAWASRWCTIIRLSKP